MAIRLPATFVRGKNSGTTHKPRSTRSSTKGSLAFLRVPSCPLWFTVLILTVSLSCFALVSQHFIESAGEMLRAAQVVAGAHVLVTFDQVILVGNIQGCQHGQ